MAHLQYMPGDPRLVDQLVYELKSKGIFDQFRKDCISDVDTKPAYQNLRQRVENSVTTFLARQCWQPDLNKNQLREKLRKHILDGNYLEQGVERIVDQVVNPKIASVFIPQVEDLVYNYLGISRKKATAEASNGPKVEDLLPNDLEAVSPGSVDNDDKEEAMEVDQEETTNDNDEEKPKVELKEEEPEVNEKAKIEESEISELTAQDSNTLDKENIPFPQEIVVENIPPPENSPPKVEIEKIELPTETSANIPLPDEMSVDIPLPDEVKDKDNKEDFFKPIITDDDDSSSDSSLRRNMSPLTPIRNYNNENSYDAQQAFENDSTDNKNNDNKEPSSFRFTIETKSSESSNDAVKIEKKDTEANLSYQFSNQVNINNFNALYDDSSNSHMLHIDYESDANSKVNVAAKTEVEHNSEDSKKDKKVEEKKSSHKSSNRSRDSHKHSSSSRDKKSDTKQSSSRDSSRHDRSKSSRDDKTKSSDKDKSKEKERSDKKDSKDSSRHRSSHKSSHKDSKSHSSSSSHRHSSKHDEKKSSSSSSHKDKDKYSDKDRNSKDKSKDSRSSSHRSDKDRKSSSSSSKNKTDDKEKDKKSKKEADDHYSLSGRGNPNRRSTDRDSNDGSSSSKGSNNPPSSKSSQTKTDSKRSSKIDTTSTSGDSTSPSDKENIVYEIGTQAYRDLLKFKPIVRIEKNLEMPVSSPPRLPFVPEVILKKPKIAANFEEAKKIMKMRKFLEEEQIRMNQEAALLLEFQANVRPSLSQVYSNVPGPELEFACISNVTGIQDNTETVENAKDENVEQYGESNKQEDDSDKGNNNEDIEIKNTENTQTNKDTSSEIDQADVKVNEKSAEKRHTEFFEVTIITEELSENEEMQNDEVDKEKNKSENVDAKRNVEGSNTNEDLKYFGEHEKYDAELERAKFSAFFKNITEKEINNKMYLINCDTYSENIFREASKDFGEFEIVNYHRNGHFKINKPTTVKNLTTEVKLPVENFDEEIKSPVDVFSPQKSECSFELSSDYNDKLEEMVNKTSRREIMEIILGSAMDTDVPKIDYCTESNIDLSEEGVKRKCNDDYSINNNKCVLNPNKIRRLSSEQISSTTPENQSTSESGVLNTRSKYLGRAARVGLPKPRRTNVQDSPSSDKSVENYEQNTTPNGKLRRQKIQRYDTSDLYKPKLHYLKRNNIT